jgi:hypothetical protein
VEVEMAVDLTVKYYRTKITKELQSYDLRIVVESATDMPEKIFMFQRRTPQPTGMDPDEFICIADPVDLEEVPEDSPDLGNEMPYFRLSEVTLRFRDMTTLEEVRTRVGLDLQKLVDSLNAAEDVEEIEEVTYV